jgi:hypothetical protein
VDYFEKAPFAFNGKIDQVHVKYLGTTMEQTNEKKATDGPAPAID